MTLPSKPSPRWIWLLFAGLLGSEFLVFDRIISIDQAWIYPRWNDQIQYLTEAYTGFEYMVVHGIRDGLWQSLVNPSAQGTLHDFLAQLVFLFTGPSRSAALSLNLFHLLAWQAALFFTVRKTSGSNPLAFAAMGLILILNSPWYGGPASVVDFRLDWMACCAFGVALALALATSGFRLTRWSLAFGAAVGLVLVTRFLTGVYFGVIFVALQIWCLAGAERWRRSGNLWLAALVAFGLAAPFFWLNREWVYNYYLIGHFTGPESAIRSPNMGIGPSVVWLLENLTSLHLGVRWSLFFLGGTLFLGIRFWLYRRKIRPSSVAPVTSTVDWLPLGAIFLLAPALVLILHSQKSELVLSILLPGAIVLVLGLWHWLAVRSEKHTFPVAISAVLLVLGLPLAARQLSASAADPVFVAGARKVNALADYIYQKQFQARLVNPQVGVDQVTDSLDGQIMRVICYERQHVWVPFIMSLPTGITEDKPEVLMQRLATSDFMFVTDEMTGKGSWPYDRQMRELYPQVKAWCEQNMKRVESFPLFGRGMTLYQRRAIPGDALPVASGNPPQALK